MWFGELSFFTKGERLESAKSLKYTTVVIIEIQSFLKLLLESRREYEKFCYIKDKVSLYSLYGDISVYCMSCNSTQHLTKHCSLITFYPRETTSLRYKFNVKEAMRRRFNRGRLKTCNAVGKKKLNQNRAKDYIISHKKEVKLYRKFLKESIISEEWKTISYESQESDEDFLPKSLVSDEEIDENEIRIIYILKFSKFIFKET